jgi:uncharacterized membrane protein YgdD (TMEM256/DUF423 family)
MEQKLQPASREEVSHIAVGSLVCAAVMVAVFALLGVFGVVRFNYTVILAALVGTGVAVLNFALMCLMVQNAVSLSDEKKIRASVQASYNGRMLFQGIWCLLAFLLPCFQVVAGILPLLFPRLVIFYRQLHGKYRQPTSEPVVLEDGEIIEEEVAEEDLPDEDTSSDFQDYDQSEPTEDESIESER